MAALNDAAALYDARGTGPATLIVVARSCGDFGRKSLMRRIRTALHAKFSPAHRELIHISANLMEAE